ncbi:MAG: sugar transferase, partial [Aeoliella sp.]
MILLCVVLVRTTSSGPAFYRQWRLGKNNKPFRIIKIRTMYCNAESLSGPVLCEMGDRRITIVGRLLRFLHLDELPQLLNVVRGDMCLVGPRPERPEIITSNQLLELVPGFAERTRVLPGITGLAQINLPADVSANCVIPKVQLDFEYIETASLFLDIRILLCTALRMIGIRYGIGVRLFRLHRKVVLAEPYSEKEHAVEPVLPTAANGEESTGIPLTHSAHAVAGSLTNGWTLHSQESDSRTRTTSVEGQPQDSVATDSSSSGERP